MYQAINKPKKRLSFKEHLEADLQEGFLRGLMKKVTGEIPKQKERIQHKIAAAAEKTKDPLRQDDLRVRSKYVANAPHPKDDTWSPMSFRPMSGKASIGSNIKSMGRSAQRMSKSTAELSKNLDRALKSANDILAKRKQSIIKTSTAAATGTALGQPPVVPIAQKMVNDYRQKQANAASKKRSADRKKAGTKLDKPKKDSK